MSENRIIISMHDGSDWAVKVSDVAEHREQYRSGSAEYFEEYPDEAIDWFQNNTNWGDLPAEMVKEPNEADYDDFMNCDMEIESQQ